MINDLSDVSVPLQMLPAAAVMNDTANITRAVLFRTPAKALLSMLPCLLFLYINGVMLFVLFRKPIFLQSSRYILFGHLLFTDSLQLIVAMLLYIFAVTMVRMVSEVCAIFILFAGMTVKISPLNLAVMSLERYVAICFPLRHADIVTSRTTGIAIAVMWTMASLDSFTQVFFFVNIERTGFTLSTFCNRDRVLRQKIFTVINRIFTIIYFIVECMIIFYTYMAIMFAVKSASTNARNASKASKTVLLHMLQLCICLISTLFDMINSNGLWYLDPAMAIHLQYALFLGLIIFPKCLSPLVYGLRDHTFRHVFQYYFTFGLKTSVKPFLSA